MEQYTFADAEFDNKKHVTGMETFLARMDALIPWPQLERLIEGHYPKAGNGRRPYDLSVMLRVHCMQLFYNLSDPMMEDWLHLMEPMRRFAGLRLSGPIPDESTILKFRHLLEKHQLGEKILAIVNAHLAGKGISYREGTIVDATIVSAPGSTKNSTGKRDPEMGHTWKGKKPYFGAKVHVGMCEKYGLVHSLAITPANVHDIRVVRPLLHGEESRCRGDAGYLGVEKRPEVKDLNIEWIISAKIGRRKTMDEGELGEEREKASVRAKGEHFFHRAKCQFGYWKVRYRGLEKNLNRFQMLAAFANLLRGDGILSRMAAA